ncbi:MAG TPA: hypothetical protein VF594_10475 [Rubricoccaceae bacterium]
MGGNATAGAFRPDSLRADSLAARRPPTPVEAALGRVWAAVAAGLAPAGPFPALDARFAGVVWDAPANRARAVDDLIAMRRAGVRAVRTEIVADTLLLSVASRLGIAFYQDLPVYGLPTADLLAQTDAAGRVLAAAIARGRPYAAARHYGLATACDTSDPRARPYAERLTEIAHAAGATTYIETRFPQSEQLAASVDLVLVDGADGPTEAIAAWRAARDTPVGLAGVGADVVPGRDGGWRTPGSASAQARTLETALTALLSLTRPPAVTFVGRWRDVEARLDARARVSGTRDGLHDASGTPRPVLRVASGFFTGTQRVFAFDAGPDASERTGAPGLLLAGWLLVVGLGVFMVAAPRLATLVPRYFGRHDLYREAVQRGYDLSAGQTALLGLGLAAAFGIATASALRALGRTDALVAATASWPAAAQERLVGLLGHPLGLAAVLTLLALAWGLLNLMWLGVLVGRRRLRPGQAVSLVVWSRWAWAPLMAAALLLAGLSPQTATALAPAILGVGLLAETIAGYRMLLDFASVTRVPLGRALAVGFGLPFALAIAGLVWLSVAARPEAAFVWHLATRG